ncbi:outer membrane beta-barrel protein [Sphingobacterium sp. DN00404]|uniref:Outer membrane beta-barrel protein n=1 Tax=Sphingobacterium micropteri TaxID=2763501 RepID=A0ABR7YSC0_9SPHI|nr:outer membrane beta-barrel family protein [Sphingobacterium micropteri]MBD1434231.1 outer membrane beta-barrel protein [Sphingobacterium micropteri]
MAFCKSFIVLLLIAIVINSLGAPLDCDCGYKYRNTRDSTKRYSLEIVDSITNKAIPSVTAYVYNESKLVQMESSNNRGIINFLWNDSSISPKVNVKHLAYKEQTIDNLNQDETTAVVFLSPRSIVIDTVELSSQPSDTITFKLDSVATQRDKMNKAILTLEGFHIQDDILYYKLKPIDKVLVNGEVFFYSDADELLKLLPAFIIDKVKIYDTVDSLEIQDNQIPYKEMNLITYEDKKNGFFGDINMSGGKHKTRDIGYSLFLTLAKNKIHSRASRNNIARYWDSDILTLRNLQPINNQLFQDIILKHSNTSIQNLTISNDLTYSTNAVIDRDEKVDSIIQHSVMSTIYSVNQSTSRNNNFNYLSSLQYRTKSIQANLTPSLSFFNSTNNFTKESTVNKNSNLNSRTINQNSFQNINIPYTQLITLKDNQRLRVSFNYSYNKNRMQDTVTRDDETSTYSIKTNIAKEFSPGIEYAYQISKPIHISVGSKFAKRSNSNSNKTRVVPRDTLTTSSENYTSKLFSNQANISYKAGSFQTLGTVSLNKIEENYIYSDASNKRTRNNFLFHFNTKYLYKNWDFSGSFNQTNILPSIQQIISDPRITNNSNVYVGNPHLTTGYSRKYELSLAHSNNQNGNHVSLQMSSAQSINGIEERFHLLSADTTINGVIIPGGMVLISPVNGVRKHGYNTNLSYYINKTFVENMRTNINLSFSNSYSIYQNNPNEKKNSVSMGVNVQYDTHMLKMRLNYDYGLNYHQIESNDNLRMLHQSVNNYIAFNGLSLFRLESNATLSMNRFSNDFTFDQIYWNLIAYQHILKSQKLKVQFAVNNILNTQQNVLFDINNNIASQSSTNINGRFWIVTLSYQVAKFGF